MFIKPRANNHLLNHSIDELIVVYIRGNQAITEAMHHSLNQPIDRSWLTPKRAQLALITIASASWRGDRVGADDQRNDQYVNEVQAIGQQWTLIFCLLDCLVYSLIA